MKAEAEIASLIIVAEGGAMNKVILCGRLTRDPEVKYTTGEKPMAIARYTLAVDRRGRRNQNDSEQKADFPSIVAFDKNGEFAEKYLKQGTKVIVTGRLQTGSYTNRDGQKVYTTEVIVEEQEFAESKNSSEQAPVQAEPVREQRQASNYRQQTLDDGFMDLPDDVNDEGLPFN